MGFLSLFGDIVYAIFGNDEPEQEPLYDDDFCFRPGLMVDTGFTWVKVVRRFLLPGSVIAATAAVKSCPALCDDNKVCRASELPIYPNEQLANTDTVQEQCETKPGVLENAFGAVRRNVFSVYYTIKEYRQQAEDAFDQYKGHTEWLIDYLKQEENVLPRAGAIGVGALAGLILGLRGGWFKRTLYASTGAAAMASVCYPKEAAEYSKEGIVQARKIATIAYNFIYGVKKDDIDLSLPQMPKIPTSFSEAWEKASELGKSASNLISGGNETQAGSAEKPKKVMLNVSAGTLVAESHAISHQSCHCPVGACLGHHDELPNPTPPSGD